MLTQRQQQIRHRRHHFHYSAPDRAAEYCDERVCLCVRVCVFVCPRSHLRNYTSDLRQFFVHVIPMAVARSFSGWRRSDIYYILPIL